MATGYVITPHGSASDPVSAKLRVNNSSADAAYAIQWRYKQAANPYSPWFEQNTTRSSLVPGTYTVNFRMKTAGSPHTAPPDEGVTLGTKELETLTVAWNP